MAGGKGSAFVRLTRVFLAFWMVVSVVSVHDRAMAGSAFGDFRGSASSSQAGTPTSCESDPNCGSFDDCDPFGSSDPNCPTLGYCDIYGFDDPDCVTPEATESEPAGDDDEPTPSGTTSDTSPTVDDPDDPRPPEELADARPRAADLHLGSCAAVGEVVASLTPLLLSGGAEDVDEGYGMPAEYSFTTVPFSLDLILSTELAIGVRHSSDSPRRYAACGEVAGAPDPTNGSLVFGLAEGDDSGFTGIAVLSPSQSVAGNTDVSVFVARTSDDDDRG